MPFKFSSLQQVLDCFKPGQALGPSEISYILWKSRTIIHTYLKELVRQGKLKKLGSWPHVTYTLATPKGTSPKNTPKVSVSHTSWHIQAQSAPTALPELPYSDLQTIEQTFYKFAENGALLQGYNWFIARCQARNLNSADKARLYVKVKKHIDTLKNTCGLIDATKAFAAHVSTSHIDKIFYADQYNWMEFGRGKLAEMTFYAKQSQNKSLIQECIQSIKLNIQCLIQHQRIDAIAIIPPSITRTHQLLKILQYELTSFGLPFVPLIKYFPNRIPVPQKSLKSREQRIRNAQQTIIVNTDSLKTTKRILLIDDFVGSWATLNETAYKLKQTWAKTIIWFAFVGNTDLSYEIINEV